MVSYSGRCGAHERPLALVRVRTATGSEIADDAQAQEVVGFALIDTGSDQSAITARTAALLGLISHTTDRIRTPAGDASLAVFFVDWDLLELSDRAPHSLAQDVRVFEDASVWAANMSGFPTIGMLGMDVLHNCRLTLDGPNRVFDLTV